jgi:phage terminase large subunit
MTWEPDYLAEIHRRSRIMHLARTDSKFLAGLKVIYRHDLVRFIEDVCFTYDPRRPIKVMPFILFPRQREFCQFVLQCLRDKSPGLVEKCRDMGFTWLCVCIAVWLWLFTPGASIGFGSRKQELVDRVGDPDSIFEKIRLTVRYTPAYLMPKGFEPRLHASFMKLINPLTDATITGEIGNSIGRGGRKLIYMKDESGWYEHPELIEAALGDNTEVPLDISSVNGAGNVFYRKRMAGEIWTPGCQIAPGVTRVFIGDWRDDPRKSQEWYDTRRARAEREGLLHIFAQEVDRDYYSVKERILIRAKWFKACIDAHKILNIKITGEKVSAQDVADGGNDKNAFSARHGILLNYADHWGGEAQEAAKKSIPLAIQMGLQEVYYDCIGVGTGFKVQVNNMNIPKTLKILPWDASAAVQDPKKNVIPYDPQSTTNEDQFLNFKAQACHAACRPRCQYRQSVELWGIGERRSLTDQGTPSSLVHTTSGSNIISVDNYTFQPGMATQFGGGDKGKVFCPGPSSIGVPLQSFWRRMGLFRVGMHHILHFHPTVTTTARASISLLPLISGHVLDNEPATGAFRAVSDHALASPYAVINSAASWGTIAFPKPLAMHLARSAGSPSSSTPWLSLPPCQLA